MSRSFDVTANDIEMKEDAEQSEDTFRIIIKQ